MRRSDTALALASRVRAAIRASWLKSAMRAAWMKSGMRRFFRELAYSHTVRLLEQCDEDAAAIRHTRDVVIPQALRAVAQDKVELVRQLAGFHDLPGAAPQHPTDSPSNARSSSGGWNPNVPGRTGPLFQQRTRKQ